ncbi:MAG: energy transducer TonB [Woeseiaceae bacterium]
MESANSKEYSSLPLVLGITMAIVVSVSGGWFALGGKATGGNTESAANTAAATAAMEDPDAETVANTAIAATTTEDVVEETIDIDANLRKARLAAAADLLVAPTDQNALFYYGRVLSADPDHAIANAELDALLASILLVVDDHLAADEFDDAYDLAMAASQLRPDHPLIAEMQNDLNEFVAALAADASKLAESGNDEEATAKLAMLKGLPGLSSNYVAAAEQVVLETQQTRSQQQQLEEEALLKEQAELDWQQNITDAIAAENLITPVGESARDYLAERDEPAELKEQFSIQLRDALLTVAQTKIDTGEFDDLESYLAASLDFGADEDTVAAMRTDFENEKLAQESATAIALSEFVRLTSAPAKYPTRASQRDITGWVEVTFTVTKSGETADIEVLRAEPEKVFDISAMEAVKKWTFEPRQYQGEPIDQRTTARLVFDLEE